MQVVNTISGQSVGPVYPSSGRWRNQANGVGSGEHTFKLDDARYAQPRVYWRDKFIEHRRTLVVSWNEKAVYAGRVVGTDWNADAHELTVRHEEIRGAFADRLPFGPEHAGAGTAPASGTTFTGRSLRGMARAVVERGFVSDNTRRTLPINLGPDYTGSLTRFWAWHEFPTIESMLTSVQDADGGPDVWLEPMWTSTGLEWQLRLGNPRLSAGTFEFVRGVPDSPVLGLTLLKDGKKQSTQTWGLGQGSGVDKLVEVAEAAGQPDMPVLDRTLLLNNIEDSAALRSLADGHAAAHYNPTAQWQFSLRVGPTVDPSLIRPGSTLRVLVQEDEWVETQMVVGRVVSVEGGLGDVLSVGVQ